MCVMNVLNGLCDTWREYIAGNVTIGIKLDIVYVEEINVNYFHTLIPLQILSYHIYTRTYIR